MGILEAIAALGITSAAIGAAGGYVFRAVEGYQQRKRERNALLRVLYEDIKRNRRQLEEFEVDNRVRLSQLLDDEQWFDIAQYFDNIVEIDEYRRGESTAETTERDRQEAVPNKPASSPGSTAHRCTAHQQTRLDSA